jgi:hypothetical protein
MKLLRNQEARKDDPEAEAEHCNLKVVVWTLHVLFKSRAFC